MMYFLCLDTKKVPKKNQEKMILANPTWNPSLFARTTFFQ